MILLTNGCSWTWDGGHPDKLVWPHHLGKHLNSSEVHNLAMGCGSNDRILRTTFNWLQTTNKEKLADTVAVIQWTEPSRYEFYVPDDNFNKFENLDERWAFCKIDSVISIDTEYVETLVKESNDYLKKWTSIHSAYKMLYQVEAISSWFNSYGVKYFYWNMSYNINDAPNDIKERILLHPWIDYAPGEYGTVFNYDRVGINDSGSYDPHPNSNGHIQLAEIIYKKIKDKL